MDKRLRVDDGQGCCLRVAFTSEEVVAEGGRASLAPSGSWLLGGATEVAVFQEGLAVPVDLVLPRRRQ